MDVLAQIFPDIPQHILERVIGICEGNVEAASDWLCENDWHELENAAGDEGALIDGEEVVVQGGDTGNGAVARTAPTEPPTALALPPFNSLPTTGDDHGPSDEEDEEDDDEDEEDDEDEDNMYFDSGDEDGGGGGGGGPAYMERRIPPLTTRTKISPSENAQGSKEQRFWVAFDDQIMQKSMIELLNISLSKLAHHRVALLNTAVADKAAAEAKLHLQAAAAPPPTDTASMPVVVAPPVSMRAKRSHETMEQADAPGYFAHFFPASDLDMVWRSVLHGHLLNRRFGELLEFRSAASATTKKRDFDELVHIHTHMGRLPTRQHFGLSTEIKCCLLLPSATSDIFRVGKNIHSLLTIAGSLYYRAHATIVEDKPVAEDAFRASATHRIRREESESSASSVLGYQPPKKVEYVLQPLDDLVDDDMEDEHGGGDARG
ncbi:Aste57867_25487 [Aphanomyces stellatus]|uniref:Aste57867_25487 protein n=1 Tax=Aphanomyces stellatus TaxID=120398 RepID=A0A485LUL3_9STRA|nr:hypothetical protein As57867_025408 [Aphanomyces stellatus]VFU02110.1 Aste57867_25487 [Aphanomyces stellatus]